ncbi:MAG: hypothetical protein JO029_03910, partial [Candidatus Eremiobacteraeota bacterium]|nr:hypothetical protein [Candidatus Eremiobacteraeota bacterium]
MEAASLLPAMDTRVLETAGFEAAEALLERIAARTSLLSRDSGSWQFCYELVRESLRRRVALTPQSERKALHGRIAAALEACGNDQGALDAYAAAGDRAAVTRLLRERGFDLVDAGCVDAVLAAIDALDVKTRREDAAILGLRGAAHATKGRPARAEGLLRRALAHAGADSVLWATITLRLALLLANRGDDVRELLDPLAAAEGQPSEYRAEALSLIAAQRALANDANTATAAVAQVVALLPSIDHDIARAKVLQRIGVAAVNTGDIDGAQRALEEAADLAMELELFSLASRAYANLCNLVLHEYDDAAAHSSYANRAVLAARRSGNQFDLQTALLQILRSAMQKGDDKTALFVEKELAAIETGDEGRRHILSSFAALRLTWIGRFSEARQLLTRSHGQFHYLFDRAMAAGLCALLLALDERRDSSSALVTETVRAVRVGRT